VSPLLDLLQRRRALASPHLLQFVKLAHLGAKNVHDDIAGIDQHPVALGQAFNLGGAFSNGLEFAQKLIGHGANMPIGPAGGYNHEIANRRPSMQIYGDNALGFGVFQGFERGVQNRGGAFSGGGQRVPGGGVVPAGAGWRFCIQFAILIWGGSNRFAAKLK